MRRGGVAPVTSVGKSERVKAGLVPSNGGGEELRARVSVNSGGKRVLCEARGKKIKGGIRGVAGGGLE